MKHQSWTENWLRLCVALCLVIGLVIATPGHAQNSQGTILGHVTDPTGAALAGAKVTITNVNTNVVREAKTSAVGDYVFVNIPPGIYNIVVDGNGFKQAQAVGVTLNVDATLRQNFALQVGAAAEQVTVEADAQMVQTDNASEGNVVPSKLIDDLPINGRDFTNLLRVQGGTTQVRGGSQLYWAQHGLNTDFSGVSVNGARTESVSYLIDGVADNDQYFATANNIPNSSAIEEFKVQNGMYSAEYGRGSAQVNVAIKSGTNAYHGSLYDYLQNDAFQPRNPLNKWHNDVEGQNLALKDPLKQNQYGFTFGGPVRIPKLYNGTDKTFFFWSYEAGRKRQSHYAQGLVPTTQELNGDFSDWRDANGNLVPIYDPTSVTTSPYTSTARTAFANNQLGNVNSVSKSLAAYFPTPNIAVANMEDCAARNIAANTATCYNYAASLSAPYDTDNNTFRFDQNFSDKDRLFVTGVFGEQKYHNPSVMPLSGEIKYQHNWLLGTTWQHTFTPNMFNEFRVGYNWMNWRNGSDAANGPNYAGDAGFQNVSPNPGEWGLPTLGFAGYNGIGNQNAGWTQKENLYQFADNLKIIHGRHTLTIGTEIRRNILNLLWNGGATGGLSFNGSYTATDFTNAGVPYLVDGSQSLLGRGNAFADFLLGDPSGISGPGTAWDKYTLYGNNYNLFFQDDFRVTPKLTVNLGLRYEIPPAYHSKFNSGAALDMTNGGGFMWANKDFANTLKNLPGGVPEQFTRCCASPTLTPTDYRDFAPRIGASWRPFDTDRLVVRAGFGMFYDIYNGWYSLNTWDDPETYAGNAAAYPTANGAQAVAPVTMSQLWLPTVLDFSIFQLPVDGLGNTAGWRFSPQINWPENKSPYNQQWTLDTQYALKDNLLLDVGYVGSHAVHQPGYWYYNAATMPAVDDYCNRFANNDNAILAGRSDCLTDPNFVPTLTRNRFPNIRSTAYANANIFSSNYNALQVRLTQRYTKGYQYQLNYTWSRTLDEVSAINNIEGEALTLQNNNCTTCDYGPSSFDQTHRLVASGSYELPVGKGRKWSLGLLNPVLGGWDFSGIYTIASGNPTTLTVWGDSTTGQDGIRRDLRRPNQVGDPNAAAPSTYAWANWGSIYNWFNPAAYAAPAGNQYGNVTRNSIRGPFFMRGDITIGKNFRISERQNLKYALEIFNVGSSWHANNQLPHSNMSDGSFGSLVHVDTDSNGNIRSLDAQSGIRQLWTPRTIQMSLQYTF